MQVGGCATFSLSIFSCSWPCDSRGQTCGAPHESLISPMFALHKSRKDARMQPHTFKHTLQTAGLGLVVVHTAVVPMLSQSMLDTE